MPSPKPRPRQQPSVEAPTSKFPAVGPRVPEHGGVPTGPQAGQANPGEWPELAESPTRPHQPAAARRGVA